MTKAIYWVVMSEQLGEKCLKVFILKNRAIRRMNLKAAVKLVYIILAFAIGKDNM